MDPRMKLLVEDEDFRNTLAAFIAHVERADQQPPDYSAVPWGDNGEWAVIDNGPLFYLQDDGLADRLVAYGFDSKAEAEAFVRDDLQAWVRCHRGEAS